MKVFSSRITFQRISAFLLLTGCLLLVLAWRGVFPAAWMAKLVSSDRVLTDSFAHLLQRSQWTLAWLLVLISPVVFVGHRLYTRIRRLLVSPGDGAAGLAIGLLALVLCLGTQHFVLEGIPHVTDETCHDFQSKLFVAGRAYAPLPDCPFNFYQHQVLMMNSGKWFSKYPPGHPLLLAVGRVLGMPGLIVPLASAVSAVALMFIVSRFYGRSVGRCAALLFALSPLTILLGASYMSHTTFLACLLLALLAFIRAMDQDSVRRGGAAALAAGLFAGWAALIRPQDCIPIAIPALAALIAMDRSTRTRALQLASLALVGLIPALAVQLAWNHQTYGRLFVLGYGYSTQGLMFLPIQTGFDFLNSYSFGRALSYTGWSLLRFDNALFGWPVSLLPLPFAFMRGRTTKADWVCLIGCAAIVLFFLPWQYFGAEYEARFYSPMAPLAIVLCARGLQNLHHWMSGRLSADVARSLTFTLPALFFLHALFFFWPCYLWPKYSDGYEQASPVIHRLAREQDISNALVLIDSSIGENEFRYSSGFIYNDPLLTNSVIYARDIPEMNDCLFNAFRARRIFRFVPNADWKHGRFEEIAGPE